MTLSIQMVNGAVSGFGSLIVSGFGFGGFQSILLNGALGRIVFVILLGFGYVQTHQLHRSNKRS
jgi:hypothetical protein